MKLLDYISPLWDTMKGILPISLALLFMQIVVLKKPLESLPNFIIGMILSILGLHYFLKGTEMTLVPLAENVGRNLYLLKYPWLVLIFGFVLGYLGTLVEPALKILALEVENLSAGVITSGMLVHGVAAGFGLGMVLGLYRILSQLPYLYILAPILILIFILSFFAPEPFASIAMDAASATTGPVNIPLNMALAVGLASVLDNVDPLLSGFGIIGLTSLGAMVSVLVLGIVTRF
ncbi:MAG: DUF1538 domain-containing protein [Tissierellia bacterium]|jgi:hypothetical protein|nr:DUF1538 domain-containing protein [Tissierellia bacterium]